MKGVQRQEMEEEFLTLYIVHKNECSGKADHILFIDQAYT